jgi:polyhydroxybutyrate depolymerase
LPLVVLLSLFGCSTSAEFSLAAGGRQEVFSESGWSGTGVDRRDYLLESGSLKAIKTTYEGGAHDLRYFYPDRSSLQLVYQQDALTSERQFNQAGKLLRAKSFEYRSDGTLSSTSLWENNGNLTVTAYSLDGQTALFSTTDERQPAPAWESLRMRFAKEQLNAKVQSPSSLLGAGFSLLSGCFRRLLGQCSGSLCAVPDALRVLRAEIRAMTEDPGNPEIHTPLSRSIERVSASGNYYANLTIDGIAREYLLHVPPQYDGTRQLPLVVVLHGSFIDNSYMVRLTRMNEKADREGFIVAYPNATGWFGRKTIRCWNVGSSILYKTDDVKFIRALIEVSKRQLAVDGSRIYVTGLSMGGALALQLGIDLSDQVAAVASVSGWMTGNERVPASAMPVLTINGTADFVVPFEGRAGFLTLVLPLMQPAFFTTSFWIRHNACTRESLTKLSTKVLKEVHVNERTGVEVLHYTVFAGEHAWPGSWFSNIAGEPTQEFNATDEIWEFFSRHRLVAK